MSGEFLESVRSIVDPLSLCVTQITSLYDNHELADATAFFFSRPIEGNRCLTLVSNWHVFAGRHIDTPHQALDKNLRIPNRVRIQVLKFLDRGIAELHYQFANLYRPDGTAIWYQHPLKSDVDVAFLNLGDGLSSFPVTAINEVATQNDMKIEIGNDVFVLGYPLGFSHFIKTPIWKRGIIASEPHAETPESQNRIVIDATTRNGMSGSPVIMREKTQYVSEAGAVRFHVNASRLLGVYSSRPVFKAQKAAIDGHDDFRAELGYVYKSGCIEGIIKDGIPGPDYGCLP